MLFRELSGLTDNLVSCKIQRVNSLAGIPLNIQTDQADKREFTEPWHTPHFLTNQEVQVLSKYLQIEKEMSKRYARKRGVRKRDASEKEMRQKKRYDKKDYDNTAWEYNEIPRVIACDDNSIITLVSFPPPIVYLMLPVQLYSQWSNMKDEMR